MTNFIIENATNIIFTFNQQCKHLGLYFQLDNKVDEMKRHMSDMNTKINLFSSYFLHFLKHGLH